MTYHRDTWAEINLDAIYENVSQLKSHLPAKTQIMAVVKANGYGHGALETAKAALEAGATWLGVALLDEALFLRKEGIKAPILVLGWTRPEDLALASEHTISLTVFQKEWLETAKTTYKSKGPAFFHIKIDTGMGRIGVRTKDELCELVNSLKCDPRFIIEGVFTHFATADESDTAYFEKQNEKFDEFIGWLSEWGVTPNLIHAANSATSLRQTSNLYNMVRFGISMYGLSPSPYLKERLPFKLKEAFALYSQLVHVKKLEPGDFVGYGATFKADKEIWVGTVPIGYADGWLRKLSGSDLIINGKRQRIIGRICMDQLMCELDQPYSVGEKVTLIGEDLTIDEVARHLETINYEIPCMINERIPRIYLRNGKMERIKNPLLEKDYNQFHNRH